MREKRGCLLDYLQKFLVTWVSSLSPNKKHSATDQFPSIACLNFATLTYYGIFFCSIKGFSKVTTRPFSMRLLHAFSKKQGIEEWN